MIFSKSGNKNESFFNRQPNIDKDFKQVIRNLQFINMNQQIKSQTNLSVDNWSNAAMLTTQLTRNWVEYGNKVLIVHADIRNPK